MNTNEFKLKLTSRAAQDSVSALIEMNNMVGYVTHVDDSARDAKFYDTVKKAYYFAAQTELDFENIDKKIYDALLILLMEAKVAYDYFCKGCEDSEVVRLLGFTNHCATAKLQLLKN